LVFEEGNNLTGKKVFSGIKKGKMGKRKGVRMKEIIKYFILGGVKG
jgi:hypothetical protein